MSWIQHYHDLSINLDLKSNLVAVHEDSEDVDLVDQGLDGRPAADAEAEHKVVDDEQGVDHQHWAPASGPAAQSTVKAPQPTVVIIIIISRFPVLKD